MLWLLHKSVKRLLKPLIKELTLCNFKLQVNVLDSHVKVVIKLEENLINNHNQHNKCLKLKYLQKYNNNQSNKLKNQHSKKLQLKNRSKPQLQKNNNQRKLQLQNQKQHNKKLLLSNKKLLQLKLPLQHQLKLLPNNNQQQKQHRQKDSERNVIKISHKFDFKTDITNALVIQDYKYNELINSNNKVFQTFFQMKVIAFLFIQTVFKMEKEIQMNYYFLF